MTEKIIPNKERLKSIEDNFKAINERIANAAAAANRNVQDVRLMAVTKTVESV